MTDRVLRVLLVDGQVQDSQWIQELLAELAENRFGGGWRSGIELFSVNRLADALLLLDDEQAREQIDAILLNPSLPDSAGLRTLNKLLNHAPGIPVVILADKDDPDLAVSMIRAGAQDFLSKTELESVPLARALRLALERTHIVQDLRATSWHEELTGLLNRHGFMAAVRQESALAVRIGFPLAVMTVELGGLEGIARKYGREEAQLALIEMADALREAASFPQMPQTVAQMPIARVDSRRFALCVTAGASVEVQVLLIQFERRLQVALRKTNRIVSIHSGVAWLRDCGTCEEILTNAEHALCENIVEKSTGIAQHQHEFAAASNGHSARRHV